MDAYSPSPTPLPPYPPAPPYPPEAASPYHVPQYYMPPPSARPTAVLVIGIIGIIYASIGILNHAGGIALFAWMRSSAAMGQQSSSGLFMWNMINSGVSLMLAILLLAASILCIRLREAGRSNLIRWAALYLCWLVFAVAISALYAVPAQMELQPAQPGMSRSAMVGIAMGAMLFVSVLFTIFPIVVLVFMRRREIRDAFAMAGGTPAVQ